MIKAIYLFTNRNLIAFDEKGEQIIDIQTAISWDRKGYMDRDEETALARIVEAKPNIWLARWQEWKHSITIDELCSLLGHGPWYWDLKHKIAEKGGE